MNASAKAIAQSSASAANSSARRLLTGSVRRDMASESTAEPGAPGG